MILGFQNCLEVFLNDFYLNRMPEVTLIHILLGEFLIYYFHLLQIFREKLDFLMTLEEFLFDYSLKKDFVMSLICQSILVIRKFDWNQHKYILNLLIRQ